MAACFHDRSTRRSGTSHAHGRHGATPRRAARSTCSCAGTFRRLIASQRLAGGLAGEDGGGAGGGVRGGADHRAAGHGHPGAGRASIDRARRPRHACPRPAARGALASSPRRLGRVHVVVACRTERASWRTSLHEGRPPAWPRVSRLPRGVRTVPARRRRRAAGGPADLRSPDLGPGAHLQARPRTAWRGRQPASWRCWAAMPSV